jgi:uncharacterized protein (DUF58 family)
MPDVLLRALDVTLARRVDSLLAGDHRSSLLGIGTELAQVRPYQPGEDDVRRIDWAVTARTGEPHVRVHLAERVLVCWLLLDTSASMTFGTADRRKADVAEGVALAVGHIASRRGNRLGVLTFGDREPKTLPPKQGRAGMLGLMTALGADATDGAGATSLGDALRRVGGVAKQRALVVVVSDFRGPQDWRKPLLQVASRHDVLAVEIRDPREQEIPDVGEITVVDPETGRHLRIDTSSARLRERFAAAAAEERAEVHRTLTGTGVSHVVVTTDEDWLRRFSAFLRRRKRRR